MGPSTPLDTYSHVLPGMQEDAVAKMELALGFESGPQTGIKQANRPPCGGLSKGQRALILLGAEDRNRTGTALTDRGILILPRRSRTVGPSVG